MRIRSIKPEFWRSDDITALAWTDRLLFIGLWSYVDDNGVGLDKLASITADLFAGDIERDPSEAFARVSRGLEKLAEHGLIARYTLEGRSYLHITNWAKHQRIDKPNKARHPLPTRSYVDTPETLAEPSRDTPEVPAPGAGEQGNRGTEEQTDAPATASDVARTPEDQIAKNAYDQTSGALVYLPTRKVAKWALEKKDADAASVERCILSLYSMGKPVTNATLGQILDGHIKDPSQPQPTVPAQYAWANQ